MIFDITREESSKKFLSDFLNIEIREIDNYIKSAVDNVFLDEFLEYVDRILPERKIEKLLVAAIHITSNDDKSQSIRDIGLVNLQTALTMDTPLARYLKKNGIIFYIYNNLLCIKNNFHDIVFDPLRYETQTPTGKLNEIARKIYSDCQISGFFCLREARAYDSDVNLRPQIICDLSKLGKNPYEFENNWIDASQAYMVKFIAPIEYFAFYSFYMGIDAFKEDQKEKLELKKWLVDQAIRVAWEHYHYGKLPVEIMAYLKSEVLVAPKYITEIVPMGESI